MIKSMDGENSFGQMEDHMKVNGKMVNSMEKENILPKTRPKSGVNG